MKALRMEDLPDLLHRVARGEIPPDTAGRAIEGLIHRKAEVDAQFMLEEHKASMAYDIGAAILGLSKP